jgi:glutamate/tyrosine decarboxylase-like PLP-dependent enzyme
MFACASWSGYGVINMTVQSSKSAGPLAAAWAVTRLLGDDGYLGLARRALEATRAIRAGAERLGLRAVGRPDMAILALACEEASVFHLSDELAARGWHVQPQLARGGAPPALHLTIGPANAPRVEEFLGALGESLEAARRLPPPGSIAPDLSAGLPRRMAPVYAALNQLPPEAVEQALIDFWGQLFR